jgi:hypothetical protein
MACVYLKYCYKKSFTVCRKRRPRNYRSLFYSLGSRDFPALRAEVPYFHVVYTLPAPISDIAYTNKAVIYDLLFRASAETTLKIAATRRDLAGPVRALFRSLAAGTGGNRGPV